MPPLPLAGALDKTNSPLRDKLALFGQSAIPLILPPGTKGAWAREKGEPWHPYYNYRKKWGERTLSDTLAPEYQRNLFETPCNVAIPQGEKTRLGAFDFDTDNAEIWQEFFAANPQFKEHALITIGRKGFTLWILFGGVFPQNHATIDFGNGDKVEWRSNGNYSVVHGLHPDTKAPYQCWVVGDGLKVPIEWKSLYCPSARWAGWPNLIKKPEVKKGTPLSGEDLSRWENWLRENYSVLDDSDPLKWQVECPGAANHSTGSKDEDTILFTGIDGTCPNFYCAHAHCQGEEGVNKEETKKILAAYREIDWIILGDSSKAYTAEINRLYAKLIKAGGFYVRGNTHPFEIIHWLPEHSQPVPLTPDTFNYIMGLAGIEFGRLKRYKKYSLVLPTLVRHEEVKAMLSHLHPENFPLVKAVMHSPILVKELSISFVGSGASAQIIARKYCPELKTIVLGTAEGVQDLQMELGEAKDVLAELISLWKWSEKIDLARAYAELFTPALLAGGFINRPIPAFLITADQPDAGKTFWHKAVGWIYGEEIDSHTLGGRSSIGGLEELLNWALFKGENFFFIDELDGKIKSPLINALLTGADEKNIRNAFQPMSRVNVNQFIVLLAGIRGFVVDEQLATRVIPIRIERPNSEQVAYQWAREDGGLVSEWIKTNSTRLLAAVYAVIKKWVTSGEPKPNPDSRFPSWSQGVNGVLENVLALPKVTFELTAGQGELSNSLFVWLDQVFTELAHLVWSPGKTPYALGLSELRNACVNAGLGIPGCDGSVRDRDLDKNQMRVLGSNIQRLAKTRVPDEKGNVVFKAGKNFIVRYRCGNKRNGQPKYSYLLSQHDAIPGDPKEYVDEEM